LAPTTLTTAEVAKRVGMTEEALRSLNNIPPRVLIKAGSSLLVPRSSTLATDVGLHTADHGQISLAPEIVLKRTVVKAGKKDSLATLALRYGVTVPNLVEWNKSLPSTVLKPGQAVVLFLPPQARALAKVKASAKPKNAPQQAKAKNTKSVRLAKR
jgi:membrane-bound lytic murein transglycosylase D